MFTVIEYGHSIGSRCGLALLATTHELISLIVYVFKYANNFLKA